MERGEADIALVVHANSAVKTRISRLKALLEARLLD
jgi:hypothetical protein